MGPLAMSVVCALYLIAGVDFALKGNWPFALAWTASAVANGGMLWASLRGSLG